MTTTILHNARLIDGTGGEAVSDATIIIEDGRFTWAGASANAPAVDASKRPVRVDVGGNTVTPGFFDVHVHLSWPGPGGSLLDEAMVLPSYRLFQVQDRMHKTLANGVTTVRDMMGVDPGVRNAVADGLIEGPRLLVSQGMLGQTGGHADWTLAAGIDATALFGGYVVDSIDEARKRVRELIRAHVDVIKIASSGGVTSFSDDPTWREMSTEMVAAIVEAAHDYGGRPVASHAIGNAGIRSAVEGGVHSIEHGYALDDDLRQQMVERGQFLVPTLLETIHPDTATPQGAAKSAKWHAMAHDSIHASVEAGVKVALGTDSGLVPAHGTNLGELPLLVQYGGMSPMQAIVAGTKTSAECCLVDDVLGTIEPGKLADVVVVAGNPLDDISLVADPNNILLVMKEGRAVGNRAGYAV